MFGASPLGGAPFGGELEEPLPVGVVVLSGGGSLAAEGSKAATSDVVLDGGGDPRADDVKHALSSIAVEIIDFQLETSFLGTDPNLVVSGGGQLDATGIGIHVKHATGTFTLSGGGTASFAGIKRGLSGCVITGGGSLSAAGRKRARAVALLSGGGALAALQTTNRFGTMQLQGGGTLAAVTTTRRRQPFAISGGGDITVSVRKRALLDPPAQITGGGALDASGLKGALVDLVDLPQGGDLAATASRRAFTSVLVSTGGALAETGRKLAGTDLLLRGGGHLWGPYPWALNPGVQLLVGDRVAIVQLPSVDAGSVQILTPQRTVQLLQPVDTFALLDAELIAQVQLISVRGLEMTRTGS